MPRPSFEQSLRWMQGFVLREWRLALPVIAAFLLLPPLVAASVLPRQFAAMPQTVAEVEALSASLPPWLMPLFGVLAVVSAAGALSLTALALIPRISVGEAILIGFRRLPSFVAAALVAGAGLFIVLVAVGTVLTVAGIGVAALAVFMFVALTILSLFLTLLMPLFVDRAPGPIAALTGGWRLYRDVFLRLAGMLILFLAGTWVVALAIRVALGSAVLLAAIAAGQPELGRTLATVIGSAVSALQWGAFYLLVAGLYRQRVGRD